MRVRNIMLFSFVLLLVGFSLSSAQKIELKNGTRIVHNEKDGAWGKNPLISLNLIKIQNEHSIHWNLAG